MLATRAPCLGRQEPCDPGCLFSDERTTAGVDDSAQPTSRSGGGGGMRAGAARECLVHGERPKATHERQRERARNGQTDASGEHRRRMRVANMAAVRRAVGCVRPRMRSRRRDCPSGHAMHRAFLHQYSARLHAPARAGRLARRDEGSRCVCGWTHPPWDEAPQSSRRVLRSTAAGIPGPRSLSRRPVCSSCLTPLRHDGGAVGTDGGAAGSRESPVTGMWESPGQVTGMCAAQRSPGDGPLGATGAQAASGPRDARPISRTSATTRRAGLTCMPSTAVKPPPGPRDARPISRRLGGRVIFAAPSF